MYMELGVLTPADSSNVHAMHIFFTVRRLKDTDSNLSIVDAFPSVENASTIIAMP